MIIDDEPLAIEVLERYVEHIDFLTLVRTFNNPMEAFTFLQKETVDLIFIDIEMPVFNGIDLLKTFKQPPKAIITTAYREYAVESYELDVIDYLVKPIPFPRFVKAVNKVLPVNEEASNSEDNSKKANELWVKVDKKLVQLFVEDIYYIEAIKDYIRIKTAGKEWVVNQTLNGVLEALPPHQFIRIHKSFIVSLPKIQMVEGNYVLIKDKPLPIGRQFKQQLLATIKQAK